ncbi:MAG TPA: hypothetical protein VHO46_16315 [Bacteroidales bacterium]|nr:hypothetical protein [Bacteroidales bacterium]
MKTKYFLIMLMMTPQILLCQEPDSASAIFSLREAERSFAKSSVMNGRRDAFVEFLADKSIIFTDKWITDAKEFWIRHSPSQTILKWEPEFMCISNSHDFGISTGPWESQEYRPNTKPLATGYFLSVWKKQEGEWKVALDAGIQSPAPSKVHDFTFIPENDIKKVTDSVVNSEGPEITEMKMLEAWKQNHSVQVYSSFLIDNARMMRPGSLPSSEKDLKSKWIDSNKYLLWKTAGSGSSATGDLGFTYGYTENPGGNYVRIWTKDNKGYWKILIDMMNPGQ